MFICAWFMYAYTHTPDTYMYIRITWGMQSFCDVAAAITVLHTGLHAAKLQAHSLQLVCFSLQLTYLLLQRVITCLKTETVANITFQSYGAHASDYPHPYLTFACAMGSAKQEVNSHRHLHAYTHAHGACSIPSSIPNFCVFEGM